MEKAVNEIMKLKADKAQKALESNNMKVYRAKNKEEVLKTVKSILKPGDTVSHGGSVTLAQCGITELLKSGLYNYLDRSAPGLSSEEIMDIYRQSFFADAYITSTNALTLNGELYNVDGNSNRVAAMLFGPKKVIVIAGTNKIVKDLDEAVLRVKTVAAPANCIRLNRDTYCAKNGMCVSLNNADANLCDGCKSEGKICKNFVVMAAQNIKDRVNVIICDEQLGY